MGEALQGYDFKSVAFLVALENANKADKDFKPNISKLTDAQKHKLEKIIRGKKGKNAT